MLWFSLIVLLTLVSSGASALDETPNLPAGVGSVEELNVALSRFAETTDWKEEFTQLERLMERTWRENGWDDESDRFAMELVRQVGAIPPWRVAERLDLATNLVAKRFKLSTTESLKFKASVVAETSGLFIRNSKVMIKQIGEYIDHRAQGKPFTPELIARWTREAQPAFQDFFQTIDRMSADFETQLNAESKELFKRDLASYQRRRQYVDRMTTKWAQGGWQPEDWGFPKHEPTASSARAEGPHAPAAPKGPQRDPSAGPVLDTPEPGVQDIAAVNVTRPTRWLPHDPSTWFAFVLDCGRRYEFDPGQQTAAKSVHDELVARAKEYCALYKAELARVPEAERPHSELYSPVRTLFEELKGRLEMLPTSAQRLSAEP